MPQPEDPMVAALLRERAAYERAGQDDRAAEVTAELRNRGFDADGGPLTDESRKNPPAGRGARSKQDTAQ